MVIVARTPIRSASLRQQNRLIAAQAASMELGSETMHAHWNTRAHTCTTERSDESMLKPNACGSAQCLSKARRGESDEHKLSLERAVLISNVYRMQAGREKLGTTPSAAAKTTATTKSWLWRLSSVWPQGSLG